MRSRAPSFTRTSVGIEICVGRSISIPSREQHAGNFRPGTKPLEFEPLFLKHVGQVSASESPAAGYEPGGVHVGKSVPRERYAPAARHIFANDGRLIDSQGFRQVR